MKRYIPIALLLISLISFGCLDKVLKTKVSDEILIAFISLAESLKTSTEELRDKNDDTRSSIIARVQEEMDQGNEKHADIIPKIDEISQRSNVMFLYLNQLRHSMERFAELDHETGEFEYPEEVERSEAFLMGDDPGANEGSGNGTGIELRKKLEEYVNQVNHWLKTEGEVSVYSKVDTLEPIVVYPANDSILIAEDPESAMLSWEAYTFQNKPVVAHIAMFERYKLEIAIAESEQLYALKSQLGAVRFRIDSLIAVDAPTSEVVAAGIKFETKVLVLMDGEENEDSLTLKINLPPSDEEE